MQPRIYGNQAKSGPDRVGSYALQIRPQMPESPLVDSNFHRSDFVLELPLRTPLSKAIWKSLEYCSAVYVVEPHKPDEEKVVDQVAGENIQPDSNEPANNEPMQQAESQD